MIDLMGSTVTITKAIYMIRDIINVKNAGITCSILCV